MLEAVPAAAVLQAMVVGMGLRVAVALRCVHGSVWLVCWAMRFRAHYLCIRESPALLLLCCSRGRRAVAFSSDLLGVSQLHVNLYRQQWSSAGVIALVTKYIVHQEMKVDSAQVSMLKGALK